MTLKTGIFSKAIIAVLGIGGLSATAANADWRDDRYSDSRWHHDSYRHDHGSWDFHIGDLFAPPAPTTVITTQRVWVEPVYRTVTDRVWVAAVYRTDTVRVWVPPVYQTQEQIFWEHGRRCVAYVQVSVAPGHYEDRTQQCLVSDGHWQNVDHTEVVCAGHFEDHSVAVQAPPPPSFGVDFNFYGR